MKRREFITLLGGAAAWPVVARAQQGERMRRIGVLAGVTVDDPEGQARHAAFMQGLRDLGWVEGRNVRIDARWGGGDADRIRRYAEELVALAPDVILAGASASVAPLQKATRSVPIVFASVIEPSPPKSKPRSPSGPRPGAYFPQREMLADGAWALTRTSDFHPL